MRKCAISAEADSDEELNREKTMRIVGKKTCSSCSRKLGAFDVLKVSLGNREIPCRSCGTPFAFSDSRKWTAIVVVILIIFAPVSYSIFESIAYITPGAALGIKYVIALFLFVVINGSE